MQEVSQLTDNSPSSSRINAINSKNIKIQKNYDFTEMHQQYNEYLSPAKKYSSGFISTRHINDLVQENEENYQSGRAINERYDIEDLSSQLNRSGLDTIYSNSQRYYSGILPLNQTIDPKLKLYNIQESMRDMKEEQRYEESSNQFINSNKIDCSFSQQLTKFVQKQNSIPSTFTFEKEEDKAIQGTKGDHQVQLIKGNSSSQSQSRPSQFLNEIRQDRKSSKLQAENFLYALQKISNNEVNKSAQDSQVEQFNNESQTIQGQNETLRQSFEKNGSYQQQKSTKINMQSLKKKEEQMRESLATRLKQFQKFFRNIKNLSQNYKYRQMTIEQKLRFNDLSFHSSKKKQLLMSIDGQRVCYRFISKWMSKIANSVPVFNPLHYAIISLDLLVFIILVSQIYVLPLTDSFRVNTFQVGIFQIFFYTIPSIILTLAIVVKFNTGYFKDNVIIKDRKKIFLQFYNTGLLIEVLSVLAVIVNQVTDNSYVYFFFILRLNLVGNSLSKIDARFSLTQRFPHFFQIIKLIFLALLLAHINGCIFNYIARDLSDSWLTEKNLSNSEWYIRYLNSVYFSFITMVTVGYGDITPISIQEKLFVICMTVYSCGAFGYIVSSIGNIFTEIAQKQANYKRQLTDIIHYMRNRNIDQDIQVQVFQYLYYLEQMDDYNHQKGEQVVQKLSPQLQSLIKMDFYFPFLSKTNIFKLNFNQQTLINATLKMKELTFGPGQVIFNQNDCDNRIFYVLKGEVQLNNINFKLCIKDETDNCFGISEFFSGEARSYSAKSKTVTQIVYLEMTEFKQILKEDPLEYEKFCFIREQVIQSKLVSDQGCFFCKQYNHIYELCPYYTFKNQRQLTIEKSKLSFDQVRKQFKRQREVKYNSILENSEVRVNLKAIRLNYINNQIIEKETMIQLIENTLKNEMDIDFYQNYDAFELHLKDDGLSFETHLIAHDRIAEEYFNVEEEQQENGSEIQDSPLTIQTNNKKLNRTSILNNISSGSPLQPITIEDPGQKIPSTSTLGLTHYQQRKNSQNSQLTSNLNSISLNNLSSNINNNTIISQQNNERFSLFKQSSTQNINQRQSFKKMSSGPRLSNQAISFNNLGTHFKIQEENLIKNTIQQLFKVHLKQDNSNYTNEEQSNYKSDCFFVIDKFDFMKEYTKYYPKFNLSIVLAQYAKSNIKKVKGIFKKKRRSAQKFSQQSSPCTKRRSRMPSPQQIDPNQKVMTQQLQNSSTYKNEILPRISSQNISLNCQKIQNINLKSKTQDINADINLASPGRYSESPKHSHFKPHPDQTPSKLKVDASFY